MKDLTGLEELRFSGTKITDEGLACLRNMKQLKRLFLAGHAISAGLEHVSGLENLSRLNLGSTDVTDDTLTHLYGLTNLRRLDLAGTFVTHDGAKRLSERLPELQLSPRAYPGIPEERASVVRLVSLRVRMRANREGQVVTANLRDCTDTSEALAIVKDLKSLTGLSFKSGCTDRELATIKGLTGLTQLRLSDNQLTSSGLRQLGNFKELEELSLTRSQIGDRDVEALTKLQALEGLLLSDTNVTDTGVAQLKELENLRFLYLTRTRVTDAALEHLRHSSALEHLDLRNTLVTEAGVAKLQKALPRCKIMAFE